MRPYRNGCLTYHHQFFFQRRGNSVILVLQNSTVSFYGGVGYRWAFAISCQIGRSRAGCHKCFHPMKNNPSMRFMLSTVGATTDVSIYFLNVQCSIVFNARSTTSQNVLAVNKTVKIKTQEGASFLSLSV